MNHSFPTRRSSDLFDGPEVFLGGQVARCLTPKAPARRVTAERMNRLMGGMRGSAEDSDQIGGPFLYCRSEEHTSELQSLMRISYAVFCLKKKSNGRVSRRDSVSAHYISESTSENHLYTLHNSNVQ